MKKVLVSLVMAIVPALVYAEAVFLNNGSIIEGKISRDSDKEVVIKTEGKDKTVPRSKIIRVLYTEDYKNKVYIFMKDNTIIEGYVVEETRDAYLYRPNIRSATEKTVKKDDLRFISKEKISLYEMQKKSEKPKLIADRKNKFINLLGLRLGAFYTLSDNRNVEVENTDATYLNIGLYFIDRFFEFNWDMYASLGEGGMLHYYAMTFFPFSMFNVELGLTIGYNQFDFRELEANDDTYGVTMNYNGLIIGLTYRWGGWFRIGFEYCFPMRMDAEYKYSSDYGASFDDFNYHDAELGFNCHAFVEVFVWTNLSIRASYRLLGSRVYVDQVESGQTPPDSIVLQNHCVAVSVGYGINLF